MDSYMTQERSHLSLQVLKKGHTHHTREVITSKPYCHKLGNLSSLLTSPPNLLPHLILLTGGSSAPKHDRHDHESPMAE